MAKLGRDGTAGSSTGGSRASVTAGMSKAPAKVQKGLDKTINRVPKVKVTAKLSDGKVKATSFSPWDKATTIKGSNKAAAKGNVPKRTPGVKKNTSLQRSINKSNNELKR